MVIVKLMGIADLITAAHAILIHYNIIDQGMGVSFSLYLIAKGILFRNDLASVLDFFVGAYILGMIFLGIQTFLVYFVVLYLIQKAIISLF